MAMRHLWCACTKFQPNPASRRALSRSQSGNGSRKTTRIIPSVSNNQILKAMRKSFVYAAGLMCLALSITDCQKELVDQTTPASEPNFELFAQPVTTKTANNGLDTRWVAKDAINVFHAEAGSTAYDSDGRFTVKDIETGRFDGTVSKSLSADKSYDWYAFYPYKDKIVSPKNEKTGYCYIGSRSDATQSQTGDNNMLHISGGNYPLYGIAKNVASSDVPSIQMQHLSSVVKIVVTNSTDEALALTDVAFTANENISGQFYISFDSETPKYTDAQYSSKIAKLAVSDVTISPKASATVYFAVKPFTAKTGTTLKLAVNGYEKTLTLKNDITFTAGHIKPLNFDYDTKLVWTLVSDANTLAAGNKLVIASNTKGKVASSFSSGYLKEEFATFSSDNLTIESLPSSALVLTLGGASGNWTLANGNGLLLGATAAKKLAFGNGTTLWSISITNTGTTIQNGTSTNGRLLHNVGSARFTTYTSDANTSMLLPQIYRLESVLPSLATPEVHAEVRDVNSVYALWGEIAGAKDYTVTCGDQTFTTAATEHTFTNLAYSTEYTVSVVANPSDETVNTPSAAGKSESVKTGANPAKVQYSYKISTSDFKGTGYSSSINTITAKSSDGANSFAVSHKNSNAGLQTGKIQFKKSSGMIYNTIDLGEIVSVVLDGVNKDNSYTVYVGSAENPTTKGSGGYFTVKETGGNTLTCTSITVVFEK